ncbi:MAG TPA: O-antigen ligase family protein [Candidatus Cybelea sp.]|jgi:O-antigen ligase|nr:O-antigen ligase family protein [Candidatus Cybelea sp.]
MRRAMPAALGIMQGCVPLLPSFIALTSVAYPGVSLLPRSATLSVMALCLVLAAYAVSMLLRYPRRGGQPLLLPLLAVVGAGLLSGLLGFDPRAGLLFTFIGLLGVIWHCAIVRFYGDRGAADAIWWAFLVSGGLAAAVAIAMVVTRTPASLYAIQHGRATGTFVLPGELAGFTIVLLPVCYAVGCVGSGKPLRMLAWCTGAVGLTALLLTFSRAGWMGFATAVAFLAAARTRKPAVAAAVVAAGAAIVLLLFNVRHDPSEDFTRPAIWQAAVQVIDRFPLLGVGPFNFSRLYALVRGPDADATAFHAHSLYLTFFAELGIVGVAALLWTIWRFAAELHRRLASASPRGALLACGVTAGLLGVAVQGLIDTVSVVIFGLWMPMLALALAAARDGEPAP